MQIVGFSILGGIFGGMLYHAYNQPLVVINTAEASSTPAEVMVQIEVEYTWDASTTRAEILKAFPDVPVMVRVASCESGFVLDAKGPTHDHGLFQVIDGWMPTALRLGLGDYKTNPRSNIAMARYLYDHGGLQHWSASRGCWNK